MENYIVVSIAFILVLGGVVAVFLPGVPTPALSFVGVLVCFFGYSDGPVGLVFLGVAALLTVLTHLFEFVSSALGAKTFGATWRGGLGAFIGGILGPIICFIFLSGLGFLAGLFIGPFVGAVVGELLGRRKWCEATKSGVGTVLGCLASMLVKLAACLFIFVGFCALLAYHVIANS